MQSRMHKTPSFRGFAPGSAVTSRIKKNNHSTGTEQERLLGRELRGLGLRFQENVKSIAGKPDFVFHSAKVLVFCDGDFWHGRKWECLKAKLLSGANAEYWVAKIESNRRRDRRNRNRLRREGWTVLRVWEYDIRVDPEIVARDISDVVTDMVRGQAKGHN